MKKKFRQLFLDYVKQYPDEPGPMWLLYSYGKQEAIEILQNRGCRKIRVKENSKIDIKDGEEFEYI